MLSVSRLNKTVSLGETRINILDCIDLTVEAGESAAIVGASGSGKTTLLSLMAGLDLPTSGEVTLDGQQMSRLSEDGRARLRRRLVGFVFQSFQLLPGLTALENVMLPLEIAGIDNPESPANAWLDKVGLQHRKRHYPRHLSGGEQQRVALARAFVTRPKILFADEPTGNLDHQNGEQIARLLFELNAESNTTLILVTHDLELAKQCRSVYLLHDGVLTPNT